MRRFDGVCPTCGTNPRVPNDPYCRSCKNARGRAYRRALKDRPEAMAEKQRRDREARRAIYDRALAACGDQCVCCGEKEKAFLTIEHTEGGGTKLRGNNPYAEYRRIIRTNGKGCTVLCANCNMAKERPGGCPHRILRGEGA